VKGTHFWFGSLFVGLLIYFLRGSFVLKLRMMLSGKTLRFAMAFIVTRSLLLPACEMGSVIILLM
jgi:hypothetical protein